MSETAPDILGLFNAAVADTLAADTNGFCMDAVQNGKSADFVCLRVSGIVDAADMSDGFNGQSGVSVLNPATARTMSPGNPFQYGFQAEMLESFALEDSGDYRGGHTEHLGEADLTMVACAEQCVNLRGLFFGQLGVPLTGSAGGGSVSIPVLTVAFVTVPPQIRQVIVAAIAIPVTAFHVGWTGTDEGFKDESVNLPRKPFKGYNLPASAVGVLFEDFLPNSPLSWCLSFVGCGDRVFCDLDPPVVGHAVVLDSGTVAPPFDRTVRVPLNTLIELPPEIIGHDRFPLRFPCEEGAGGGKSAFRVYSPSPGCSTGTAAFQQGGAA